MQVIWKRPDGHHDAAPSDFRILDLAGHSKIWLHKTDHKWFPFRISGGWQDEEETQKLNAMINLIDAEDKDWVEGIVDIYGNSDSSEGEAFIENIDKWLNLLSKSLKGDTWERDIMENVLTIVQTRLNQSKSSFLTKLKT